MVLRKIVIISKLVVNGVVIVLETFIEALLDVTSILRNGLRKKYETGKDRERKQNLELLSRSSDDADSVLMD